MQVPRLARVAGGDDQPIHLLLRQKLHRVNLLGLRLVAIGDQQPETVGFHDVGNTAQNRSVERVLNIAGHDADSSGLAGNEAARQRIGPIAQLLGDLEDLFFLVVTGVAVTAQHAPRGRRGNTCCTCDIGDRRLAFRSQLAIPLIFWSAGMRI